MRTEQLHLYRERAALKMLTVPLMSQGMLQDSYIIGVSDLIECEVEG